MLAPAPAIAPCPAPFNLAAQALRLAPARGAHPALEILHGDRVEVCSYGQLEAAVRGCGTGLLALGLTPGARVLMRMGNSAAFPILFLGAITVGLVPVPTSAALTEAEITPMAAALNPALVVADAGVALPAGPVPVLAAAALAGMATLPPAAWAMGDPDRLAYVIYTSGTAGKPMAVAHAHRALWARGMMRDGWEGLGPKDRLLHAGAFNWTYTLGTGLLDPWSVGATALIPANGMPVAELGPLAARHRATIFAAAPGIYRQMLRAGVPDLPDLRHGLSAGEALSPDLRAKWQQATGTDLHEALGLSECSTFLSGSPTRPAPEGTAGFAQTGRRVAVLDETGANCAPDQPGTLAVHRNDPGLMIGYLDQAEATSARFKGDWFVTGDQVSRGADGAYRFLGRSDDMMNAGGFKVSPLEVEAVMATLPTLVDCAVTEVEITTGTRIIACFYTATDDPGPEALRAHAARHLARWKQPRHYQRLDALPRNANLKLNRRALARLLKTEI